MTKRILLVIIKNTACMDYAIPLFEYIRNLESEAHISVLYCSVSRFRILREGKFYNNFFTKHNISQFDLSNQLDFPFRFFGNLIRMLLRRSERDNFTSENSTSFYYRKITDKISALTGKLEKVVNKHTNIGKLLQKLNPDIVLFDNTSFTNFSGRSVLFEYLNAKKVKTVLLPHAPHHSDTNAFTPFDEKGEALPSYCEFWMPFKYDVTWNALPQKKEQFFYIGYPGLDSKWLSQISKKKESRHIQNRQKINCLLIVRKFVPKKGIKEVDFMYDYDEFIDLIGTICRSVYEYRDDINFIIKPHPSNDYKETEFVFSKTDLRNWSISYEPVYDLLHKIDFVISLYSTTLLIPAMLGIPTILINSSIQEFVHKEESMRLMYTGLPFFVKDEFELTNSVKTVISQLKKGIGKKDDNNHEAAHLRDFFPDYASERAYKRLF